MVAYKGADSEAELETAQKAIKILGGEYERMAPTPLHQVGDEHKIVLIKKTDKTGSKYPRKAGTPAKEPIR